MKLLPSNGILQYARPYRIENKERVDQETGEILVTDGIKIKYTAESLSPTSEKERGNVVYGEDIFIANIPYEFLEVIKDRVPGMFKFTMQMKNMKVKNRYSDGEQEIQKIVPVKIEYVGELEVTVKKPAAANVANVAK